jgi:hypothetical protein
MSCSFKVDFWKGILMSDIERKTDYRERKQELGLSPVNLYLDSTAVRQLNRLIEDSAWEKGRPSGQAAVVTEAINRMYLDQIRKTIVKSRTSWLDQNRQIARNIITHLFKKYGAKSLGIEGVKTTLDSNRFPSAELFKEESWEEMSDDKLKKLSRVAIGGGTKKKKKKVNRK